eukprot:scaffold250_cov110-Isochrysis_galbana.AAC.14
MPPPGADPDGVQSARAVALTTSGNVTCPPNRPVATRPSAGSAIARRPWLTLVSKRQGRV